MLSGDALAAQGSTAGTYVKMDGRTQYGRAIYQQSGGSQYLYFWETVEWYIGYSDYDAFSLVSADRLDAQCPEAAGTWLYYSSSLYSSSPETASGGVSVSCLSPPVAPGLLPLPPPPLPPFPPPSPAPPFACGCEVVEIALSGDALASQSDQAGTFFLMDGVTQNGRAVYQQSGGAHYLYFWVFAYDIDIYAWRVGDDYALSNAALSSWSSLDAQCPEAASWQYWWSDSAWESGGGVAVGCPLPPYPPGLAPAPPPPVLPSPPPPPFACACDGNGTFPFTAINGMACPAASVVIVDDSTNGSCISDPHPHYDPEGMVCADDSTPNEAYCTYALGPNACARCGASPAQAMHCEVTCSHLSNGLSPPTSPPPAVPPLGPPSVSRPWGVITIAICLAVSFGGVLVAWPRRHRLAAGLLAWPRRHQRRHQTAAAPPASGAQVRLELAADTNFAWQQM